MESSGGSVSVDRMTITEIVAALTSGWAFDLSGNPDEQATL
jgi:hypothetical protein